MRIEIALAAVGAVLLLSVIALAAVGLSRPTAVFVDANGCTRVDRPASPDTVICLGTRP